MEGKLLVGARKREKKKPEPTEGVGEETSRLKTIFRTGKLITLLISFLCL